MNSLINVACRFFCCFFLSVFTDKLMNDS
uniref:Uncharacterized protein n=1 Tax=Anguilla anguilla TaxID=7936 RepID=A0A0E9VZZ0_ANGAN